MVAARKAMWQELQRAVGEIDVDSCAGDITIHFSRPARDILSICSDEIDNQFGAEDDRQYDWRWEIYLHENGRWTIE